MVQQSQQGFPRRKLPQVKADHSLLHAQKDLLDPSRWSTHFETTNTNNNKKMVHVRVIEPMNQGEGRNMYTTYCVVTLNVDTDASTTVRRRYSDFQWLYHRLHTEYPGAIVPIIPHKRALRNEIKFDPDFIEERRKNLESFLQFVIQHPELIRAPSMTPFMTAEIGDKFDLAKKTIEAANPTTSSAGTDQTSREFGDQPPTSDTNTNNPVANVSAAAKKGFSNFLAKAATLAQVSTGNAVLESTKEEPEIDDLKLYLHELETHVKQLVLSSTQLCKTTKDKANAIHTFGVPIGAWKQFLHETISPNKSNSSDDPSISVTTSANVITTTKAKIDMLSAVTRFTDDHTSLLQQQYNDEMNQFQYAIKRLEYNVRAFQFAIKQRKEIQVKYTTKRYQLTELEEKLFKSKRNTSNQGDDPIIARHIARKEELDAITNSLHDQLVECSQRILREAKRVQPQFDTMLQNAIRKYIQVQIKYHTKSLESWNTLLPKLTLPEPSTSSDDGNNTNNDTTTSNGAEAKTATTAAAVENTDGIGTIEEEHAPAPASPPPSAPPAHLEE